MSRLITTLRAEHTKLFTTASVWWTSGLALVISLLVAALLGAVNAVSMVTVLSGVSAVAVPAMMIQATMVVTTEYRYGLTTGTYLANPRRTQVAAAKFLLYATFAALWSALIILACYGVAIGLQDQTVISFEPFSDPLGQRYLWAYPLAMVGMVMLMQGLGLIVRQTAGAVAIGLVWYLALESMVKFLPRIGQHIAPYLPMVNLEAALFGQSLNGTDWPMAAHWLLFFGWAAALWVIGIVLLNKRDV